VGRWCLIVIVRVFHVLVTDVTHALDRMRVVASQKNYKSLIYSNWCVTSVSYLMLYSLLILIFSTFLIVSSLFPEVRLLNNCKNLIFSSLNFTIIGF